MPEDALKIRINQLEKDLEKKEQEILSLLDKIEELEDHIMHLEEEIIPSAVSTKKSKKMQAMDSIYSLEIEEKDKQIRELKDKMGFLRKENIELQQKLEKLTNKKSTSSVIRIEDLKPKSPLNALVNELQDKVNKQRSTINDLKRQVDDKAEISEILKEKEEEIATLKSDISKLNQSLIKAADGDKESASIQKTLIDDLQNELNKSKRKIQDLTKKLEKFKKKEKKGEEVAEEAKVTSEINDLKELLEKRDIEIQNLKTNISTIQQVEVEFNTEQSGAPSEVLQDLQNKLNKAKIQIGSLQEQLKQSRGESPPERTKPQSELEGQLKMQREMAIFLQKQLEIKEGEMETIKNEAVQIKGKYKQLESQIRIKDKKINELQEKLESSYVQPLSRPPPTSVEDPNLTLRLKELKSLIEDLKKQNAEQRLEISVLRKK
ncbi:MAG: hypothetical protein ACFE8L_02610 [Candidatus Hodarchaeota archaeon]